MSGWQKIFEDSTNYRAEMVKDILLDHELEAVVVNKKDNAYQLGNFEVHVPPDHVLKAIKIVKEEIKFE